MTDADYRELPNWKEDWIDVIEDPQTVPYDGFPFTQEHLRSVICDH